jgi:hypothetical protein
MRTASDRFEDDRLDRLVDGELNESEYREALRSLDERPGGWRVCALAFLEAQAWRRELGDLRRAPDGAAAVRPVALPLRAAGRSWMSLLTLAASFLLVFALGVGFHAQWPLLAPASPDTRLADDHSPAAPTARAGGTAETPTLASDDGRDAGGQSVAGDNRRGPAGRTAAPNGNLRVLVGDGPSEKTVDVPLYDWTPGMLPQPTQVPPEVQRALQRTGRELRWKREFVPLKLDGGRRALLPVEQLEVTPVEHGLYQ